MIIVWIEHFLTPSAKQMFADWITDVGRALANIDGFVSIRQLTPIDSSNEYHLLLEFESLDLLRVWSSSKTHDDLLERLKPYRTRKHQSRVFMCKK